MSTSTFRRGPRLGRRQPEFAAFAPQRAHTSTVKWQSKWLKGCFEAPEKQCVHIDRVTFLPMAGYVVKIGLPDRPGALGQVASRIGAVGGDIVAINILERDGGRAIDEFVIEIGGQHLIDLLRSEIHEVDGVSVLDIRAGDSTTTAG